MIPSEYNGREQTFIKHEFLTEYIEVLAFKKLFHNQILNYVDAFAGPWRTKDIDGLSDTSFDLTLKRLVKVKDILEKKQNKPVEIRFCLCEKEVESFEKLQEYSKNNTDDKIKIFLFHGKFEDQLEKISNVCETGFTFTFIDPTGWKIDSDLILKFLNDQNGEFLINFMAEHINRHATYSKVSESFGLFLANPKWKEEFNSLSNGSTEERILTLFKKKIKDSGAAKYTPNFSIQKPRENRVKMRLLLGTNSPIGLRVFRDVQETVEKLEIKIRNQLHSESHTPLFNVDELNDLEHKSEGIGNIDNKKKAKDKIVEFLTDYGPSRFDNISNFILDNVSIRQTQLKDLVVDLKQRSIIVFDLPKGKRKPLEETKICIGNKPLF